MEEPYYKRWHALYYQEPDGETVMSRDPSSTYYDAGGIETLDIIRAKLTTEQYQGYILGNLIKYACRMNYKGQLSRDAEKVAIYGSILKETLDTPT